MPNKQQQRQHFVQFIFWIYLKLKNFFLNRFWGFWPLSVFSVIGVACQGTSRAEKNMLCCERGQHEMPIAAVFFLVFLFFFGVDLAIANIILFDKKLFNFFLIVSLLFYFEFMKVFFVFGRHICFCAVTFLFCEFWAQNKQVSFFLFLTFNERKITSWAPIYTHIREIFSCINAAESATYCLRITSPGIESKNDFYCLQMPRESCWIVQEVFVLTLWRPAITWC